MACSGVTSPAGCLSTGTVAAVFVRHSSGNTQLEVSITEFPSALLVILRNVQLFRLSVRQAVQVRRLSTLAEIEPDTHSICQRFAGHWIDQVPRSASPDFRQFKALFELTEHRFDALANPLQQLEPSLPPCGPAPRFTATARYRRTMTVTPMMTKAAPASCAPPKVSLSRSHANSRVTTGPKLAVSATGPAPIRPTASHARPPEQCRCSTASRQPTNGG